MKRSITTLAVLGTFALALVPGFAATGHAGHDHNAPAKPPGAKKVVSDVCPVSGDKIPDITKAAGKSVYKGKTYYFCCKPCKPKFDKDPAKYVKEVVSAVCPVMGTKIPDVTKAAGKSTYKGKTYYFCCKSCKPKFDKDPAKYAKPAASKKVVSAVCPVMGTKIPDVTKGAGKSVYKGKTYYFCRAECKPLFDKNPAKYVK